MNPTNGREQPPNTRRPGGHPVVQALESDDRGAAILKLMFDAMAPGPWHVETQDGFWWIPHRLQHLIEVFEDEIDGGHRTLCRSTFHLVTDAHPGEALTWVNYLNQRPFGCSLWSDDDNSIFATSSVELDPRSWWNTVVFSDMTTRLVGICEHLAPRLAGLCEGSVAEAMHPTLGARHEPDQFLREHLHTTLQPEATTGPWSSQIEIESMRRSLRFFLQQAGLDNKADKIDPQAYDSDTTSVTNLRTYFREPVGTDDQVVEIKVADHPDLGRGVEVLVATSVLFDGEGDPALPPTNSLEALSAANLLNRWQATVIPGHLSVGAWSVWRGQMCRSTFIDGEITRTLQTLATPRWGEVLALITSAAADSSALRWAREQKMFGFEHQHTDDVSWYGVEQNAGHHSLLVDDEPLIADATAGIAVNELIEPVELDGDIWALQHSTLIATFGIFNPSGPSVGSIEVAINYASGSALLLERLRHPFSPSLHLHAVLDRDGFDRLSEFVGDVVAALKWGALDWFEIVDEFPDRHDAITRGLRTFAERSDFDPASQASNLLDVPGSPWDRLHHETKAPPRFSADDPIAFWIAAITLPSNIDNHVAHLRSAWEGARLYLDQGPDEAEAVKERLVTEIWLRSLTP